MTVPAIVRIPLMIVAILVLTACGLVGSRPTSSPVATAVPPTIPSAAPTAERTRRPPPTTDLPQGFLSGGGDPIEGWLGSYCWQSTCADAPATPAKDQLPPVVGEEGGDLEFSLADGATFHTWRATYSSGRNDEPITLGQGGEGFDPDALPSAEPELLSAVTFASPPTGDWVVFVQVFFDGGDLSYAWHITVS